ncbi:MAG: hypothetical protein Q9O62_09525 [Ardenticatenia bacterium]|nr:hypothetical protein [Ardenticatenia bacterium]
MSDTEPQTSVQLRMGQPSRPPLHLILLVGLAVFIYVAPLGRPGWMATHMGVLPLLRVTDIPLPSDTPVAADVILPYALAKGLVRLGATPVQALKVGTGLAVLVGSAGVAALAARTWGWAAGAVAAALFVAAPVHLTVRFIRGVPGDAWFWALVVWAAWALGGQGARWRTAAGLLLALLLLIAWPTRTWLALPALLIVTGASDRPRQAWWRLGLPAWAVGLAMLVWWRGTGSEPSAPLHPFQLFSAAWPAPTPSAWVRDGSYQVGAVALVGTAIVLAARRQILPSKGLSAAELGTALAFTAMVWPLMPWTWATRATSALGGPLTLTALASLLLALVTAHLPRLVSGLNEWPWLSLMVALITWSSYPLLALPTWPEESVTVRRPPSAFQVPGSGSAFLLLDVLPEGAPVPGQPLNVTVRWQLLRPVSVDYTAFVHLVTPEGSLITQDDRLLLTEDERPSTAWGVGEIVEQSFELRVPPEAPAGPYTLRLGLYVVETLERLPLLDGRDAVEVSL